ncbi:pantetheine-phosphate adenylyltransferase [Spiroplasma clarkii]|uniref:Phosphopantetheine adenylyltransferase n=1 Tax=Spiroplasma clarkii TaxID=2139 RepID=A0A2K8KFU7_9MOLU|nr:pantetheine-phosphate adenylyltransferase [Spiroplasma clarkii]ATX70570.1 phosphopantetheine adenylyltransferase [Spiroplasma clarkii]
MKAIYPGSFNPFHEGHLQILKKARKIFDLVYLVISKNIFKDITPDLESRIAAIKASTSGMTGVEIIINEDKLTAELAAELGVDFIIRGIRDKDDLEYEMEISDANKTLNPGLETVIFIADSPTRKISSTRLKEIQAYRKG